MLLGEWNSYYGNGAQEREYQMGDGYFPPA